MVDWSKVAFNWSPVVISPSHFGLGNRNSSERMSIISRILLFICGPFTYFLWKIIGLVSSDSNFIKKVFQLSTLTFWKQKSKMFGRRDITLYLFILLAGILFWIFLGAPARDSRTGRLMDHSVNRTPQPLLALEKFSSLFPCYSYCFFSCVSDGQTNEQINSNDQWIYKYQCLVWIYLIICSPDELSRSADLWSKSLISVNSRYCKLQTVKCSSTEGQLFGALSIH